jgi:recombination protein RecA
MSADVAALRALLPPETVVRRQAPPSADARRWSRVALSGRLTEISAWGGGAALTLAVELVLSAQREGEPSAWITTIEDTFYPPDAARNGVDLDALLVVRCPAARAMGAAADKLARSGAFGLIVIDLGERGDLAVPTQSRLVSLAQKHDCAVVCLTKKTPEMPSLGSLVALRVQAEYEPLPDGRFVCGVHALKDKQRGPGWSEEVVRHGPPGLC